MADNEALDQRVYELAQTCAAILKGQEDLHNRLFVDGGGILPGLYGKVTILEKGLETKADVITVVAVQKEVTALKEKGIWQHAWGAGFGAGMVFAGKWIGAKFGLHF